MTSPAKPPGPIGDDAHAEALLADAHAVRNHAHAPYSRFPVGAALRDAAGRTFAGCNVENASYGLTICAERVAMGSAVAAGAGDITHMAIVAAGNKPVTPCGACRQVLVELAPTATIYLQTADRKHSRTTTTAELLPGSFSREDLAAGTQERTPEA